MVFSSVTFLFFFLPAFLLCYYLSGKSNWVLLLGSLVFYSFGEARYVPLLAAYMVGTYLVGLALGRGWRYRRVWLTIGIVGNLAGLFFFKYFGFAVGQLLPFLGWFSSPDDPLLHIPLPLGISFFTFQSISYLVDVYRGDVSYQPSLIKYGAYKTMFPQLVAGPIVRYAEVASEIDHREVNAERFERGIILFVVGLGQKVLIANTVAFPADQIFGADPALLTPAVAWLGAACYTLQIYFDFCGYSNMAMGLGHMMGFTLPPNFNRPYISQSVTEFWRRWHMTLSRWFRDYLYIPLGGNRAGPARTYFNLGLVFLLCGLWHGASLNFVAWGAYYGALLIVERLGLGVVLERLWQPLRHLYLLVAVILGWVIFRADTLSHAGSFLAAMVGAGQGDGIALPYERFLTPELFTVLVVGAVLSALPSSPPESWAGKLSAGFAALVTTQFVRFSVLALFVFAAARVTTGTYNPFIYFRF